ncbi:MAG: AI-2E family transporter [Wigglesworthia glossinidia]|nr:AI-2E family transporter [Wigglesworthia glossinidia]
MPSNISKKKIKIANLCSLILVFFCMLLSIPLHLFPCYISGFTSYNIVLKIIPFFSRIITNYQIRWIIISLMFVFFIILVTLIIFSLTIVILSDLQYIIDIFTQNTDFFSNINKYIPNDFSSFFLDHTKSLKDYFIDLIKDNLILIKHAGKNLLHGLITIFISFIIGILIAINQFAPQKKHSTLFMHKINIRLRHFSESLKDIFFSQIKISLVNTFLTSLIILIIFPIFGIYLPLGKTLIIVTFIFGLIPIIGNFISNCVLIASGLSISLKISGIMLLYLVFIHKLEYFLNAKIIGTRIHAKSWELLLSMLIFESFFGIEGLVVAPIFYAYLKRELQIAKFI